MASEEETADEYSADCQDNLAPRVPSKSQNISTAQDGPDGSGALSEEDSNLAKLFDVMTWEQAAGAQHLIVFQPPDPYSSDDATPSIHDNDIPGLNRNVESSSHNSSPLLECRQQAKLFTDAMDEAAEGNVAHVTEAMHVIHIQEPNLNKGIPDFETPDALCNLLRESYKSLYVLQPFPTMFILEFIINPAWADPAKAKAYQYPNWKGWCIAANVNSPTPHRLHVAIWDAREYFSLDKNEDMQYKHENITLLPHLEQELEYGDRMITGITPQW
ncbi:hypothetical protein C8Q80DRAFT_1123943 [Daedaleopsis nitida]|nr:hypothetical protein C8Q80DRAFT_1123943 [Daedaleopsis nitida]